METLLDVFPARKIKTNLLRLLRERFVPYLDCFINEADFFVLLRERDTELSRQFVQNRGFYKRKRVFSEVADDVGTFRRKVCDKG